MGEIFSVVGQAGTGKTTWLMQKANELAPRFLKAEHHKLLAITRMHGSRRRLHMKLVDGCPSVPYSVATIDSFALSLLNRWRRSLGYIQQIQPVDDDSDFVNTVFGIEAGFSHILITCARLLESETVQTVIRESYPLIMIDELQDCDGPLLDFVKALSTCSTLIVAADGFQLLDSRASSCIASEWLRTKEEENSCHCTELTQCHRTSVSTLRDKR